MTAQSKTMQELWQDSYLASGNESYLEEMYESYLSDPQSVSTEWSNYFDQLLQKAARCSYRMFRMQLSVSNFYN